MCVSIAKVQKGSLLLLLADSNYSKCWLSSVSIAFFNVTKFTSAYEGSVHVIFSSFESFKIIKCHFNFHFSRFWCVSLWENLKKKISSNDFKGFLERLLLWSIGVIIVHYLMLLVIPITMMILHVFSLYKDKSMRI